MHFLFLPEKENTGTGILRVRQLAELFREVAVPMNRLVIRTSETDQKNAIVLLTKYVAQHIDLNDVDRLRRRGNTIVVDFVDAKIRDELANHCDILIASSIEQHEWFKETYRDVQSHLITHHVDTRISAISPDHSHFRAAYFGQPLNAKHAAHFADHVDFYPVVGPQGNIDWFDALPDYALHYAVRNRRSVDGFKPFVKGFIAAHSHANIIIQKSEREALRYLTDEYPFIIANDDRESVERGLASARESFGGPEWRRGLEIMEEMRDRSSKTWILNEIRSLFRML